MRHRNRFSKGRSTRALARVAGRRSAFEMEVEAALNALLGREVEYEATRLEYVKRAAYVPDFDDKPYGPSVRVHYEAKGRFLSKDRSKLLAVKKAHPSVDIRLVFQRNNKLSKTSNTTYMDWAAQHGFPAAVFPDLPIGDTVCQPSESTPASRSSRRQKGGRPKRAGGARKRCSSTSKRPHI